MAKCEMCGKIPQFGQSRSKSFNATKRKFKVNIQRIRVMGKDGQYVRKSICAKCVKTLAKSK